MNIEELTNIFTYHPPFGDQEVRYQIIREQAKSLAIHIEKWCPRSREKSLAITKLQECVMMANASIAIHEAKPEVAPTPPPESLPLGEAPPLHHEVSDEERAEEQAEKEEAQEQAEEQAEIRDENIKAEQEQKEAQMREEAQ